MFEEKLKDRKFEAGDVVMYPSGRFEYLVDIGDGCLGVNATNTSTGRLYCEELWPFDWEDRLVCKVIGHYGNGTLPDAIDWYYGGR